MPKTPPPAWALTLIRLALFLSVLGLIFVIVGAARREDGVGLLLVGGVVLALGVVASVVGAVSSRRPRKGERSARR